MPYTLVMGLAWFAGAFALGLVVGVAVRSVTARRQVARARSAPGGSSSAPAPASSSEADQLRIRVAELEGELHRVSADPPLTPSPSTVSPPPSTGVASVDAGQLERDDLTAVVGLGPSVAELCHGIGITTWRELADTEVSLLRTLLDDAGARYRVHDPTSWPEQARLLAEGRWEEFHTFVASVREPQAPDPTGQRREADS